jgi:hypothetical protein
MRSTMQGAQRVQLRTWTEAKNVKQSRKVAGVAKDGEFGLEDGVQKSDMFAYDGGPMPTEKRKKREASEEGTEDAREKKSKHVRVHM